MDQGRERTASGKPPGLRAFARAGYRYMVQPGTPRPEWLYRMAIKAQKMGLQLAARTGFDYIARSGMKRPEWLYRPDVTIPRLDLTFAAAVAPTPETVELCRRLIAAFQRSSQVPIGNTGAAPLWTTIIDAYFQDLAKALQDGDPNHLAVLLSTAFQQRFLFGISSASLFQNGLTARFWYWKCLDDLVSLAEYLGVVPVENPEQGGMGHALKNGPEALVQAIEQASKIDLRFPEIAGAYGFRIGQSLITMETPEHTYAALRVNAAMQRILPSETISASNIVEIGAGFGGTAYRLLQLRQERIRSYTIIDLPLMNVMQGYFLGSVFGPDRIALYGEQHPDQEDQRPIRVMPTVFIDRMTERNVDVLFNENSMPEMPECAVEEYLGWARRSVRGIFYSYNQEAAKPVGGVPQVRVPAVVARVGGFRRLSRDHSWVRRGYVEEVYRLESAT